MWGAKMMTDNEITKALECCGKNTPICIECSYKGKCNRKDCYDYLKSDALDLINRQKAEIEMLQGLANHHRNVIDYLNNGIAIAKAKAIKEFVMRFEKKIRDVKVTLGQTWEIQSALKEVEKEMVGDENG